ncbi:GNAT family N-acetyltransferase, partial [Bordetella hinzii]|nr:GNAT family N-acetyltransferase [Bordetella hinzii]
RREDCAQLVLDTGLGNALAQRFYFRQGLLSAALHFRQAL